MRRLVLALVLVAGAFGGYRHYATAYAPEKVYKAFAEDILHQQYERAAKKCDGLTAGDLGKLGSQERIGAGPAMFQTLFPSRFRIDSRQLGADGAVTLHAVQTVLFNPVGVESAIRPAMYATLNQTVTLRKTAGEWRVIAFDNKFEKLDDVAKR
ncbi:MAG TPA: hypothetical protein VHU41_06135 [Thermoanaerobaculia bacterium]|jgi:hypothetical protein|nr:hypothetical protein [Thermoanaerobaculia bacterium]